jgi:hypothetical protein
VPTQCLVPHLKVSERERERERESEGERRRGPHPSHDV